LIGERGGEACALGVLGSLHQAQCRLEEARPCFEQSLAIRREIGDRLGEGLTLGNLGSLLGLLGLTDEAERSFERALAIHHEAAARRLEGIALGGLARLRACQGRRAEFLEAFAGGERLLREVDDRIELGKLLASRGEADLAAGELAGARAALTEATSLAAAIGVAPESALGRSIDALRSALGDSEPVPATPAARPAKDA